MRKIKEVLRLRFSVGLHLRDGGCGPSPTVARLGASDPHGEDWKTGWRQSWPFRALMILSKSSQLNLREGGTSVMRYEFNPPNKAMIGALQDCLLSARPR